MNYPYVIPGQQGQPEIFASNISGQLGYYDKPVNAKIQLEIDYSLLPAPPAIASYSFQITPGGEPQLRVSAPQLDTTSGANALRFVIEGGIAGRTYTMTINVIGPASGVRSDVLVINVLDDGYSESCQIINPLPINNGATSPDGSLFVNTAPRLFVSATPPTTAQVMDQWYNTTNGQVYINVSNGTASSWMGMAIGATGATGPTGPQGPPGPIPEAPTDGNLYSRQSSAWTPTTVPMNDNRIINGDMRIDARNNGASGTATNVYTVDRWLYSATQPGKGSWRRSSPLSQPFPYALLFTSLSAYTSLASDLFYFAQPIEADMVSDFQWSTPNAQPVTLSFWATSSLGGTFSGCVFDYAATRSYPFSYALAPSTWTKITITIPGDTGGSWVMSGNGGSMWVCFDLGCGSTFRGPAGAWATGNYRGVTGAVSPVSINGATFLVTGVKLEIGSIATPYPQQSLAKRMADCQRYYQVFSTQATTFGNAASTFSVPIFYQFMRASPTGVLSGLSYTNATALTVQSLTVQDGSLLLAQSAAGPAIANYTLALSAEI